MAGISTTTKRVPRIKKADIAVAAASMSSDLPAKTNDLVDDFTIFLQNITLAKDTFEKLQKQITETQSAWDKEQKEHEIKITERDQQDEILRKREQELYEYETQLVRKKAEDEFSQRKIEWERELEESKEVIEKDRLELEILRKQVSGFEVEKEKAVNAANGILQKDLTVKFESEKKLREQEIKGEKAILDLKITMLTQEASRQREEIVELKRALEKAATQLKEMAVSVIESGKQPTPKLPASQNAE